jgi:hypothetical protein
MTTQAIRKEKPLDPLRKAYFRTGAYQMLSPDQLDAGQAQYARRFLMEQIW